MYTSTGIINLKASKTHKNKFEQGMIDEFTVEAVDIGPLKKLRIGHDNCGTVGPTPRLTRNTSQNASTYVITIIRVNI